MPIGDRAFDLLVLLTHHAGAVLSNRFLMQGVWPNTVVEENNVRAQIMTIRKILGGGAECAHIVNVTGRGYCFTAPVQKRNVVPMPELRLPRPHQFAQVTA